MIVAKAMYVTFLLLICALALLQQCGGNHSYHVVIDKELPCTVDVCLTLNEYAENADGYFTSDTTLRFLPGNHTLDVGGFVEVRNVHNLSLIGEDSDRSGFIGLPEPVSRIICSGSNQSSSGFAFINASILFIERLLFSNCGALTIKFEPEVEEQLHSIFEIGGGMRVALFFFDVESVKIENTTVQKSFGYGLLGLNAFQVSIRGSAFVENNILTYTAPECMSCTSADGHCIGGNALFVFQDYANGECTDTTHTLKIMGTTYFIYGVDVCEKYPRRVHSGGGLGVLFGQSSYGVEVDIRNTYMSGNTGTEGGNLYLEFMDFVKNSSVIIESCSLEYGNAIFSLLNRTSYIAGGGLGLRHGILHGKGYRPMCQHTRSLNRFIMLDCNIVHNEAIYAAGGFFVTGISNYPNIFSIQIIISTSIFSENIAIDGSTVFLAEVKLSPYVSPLLNQIVFQNIKFSSNRLDKDFLSFISNNTINTLLGVVWVVSSPHVQFDNCTFDDNEVPGLAASDSNIIFIRENNFKSNYGLRGGGMGLSQSTMYLLPHTHINFVSNFALQRGGGIYVDNSPLNLNYCFFQIYDPTELNETELDIAVTLQNNTAVESGTSLYGGTIDHCVASTHSYFSDKSSTEIANYIFQFNDSGNSVVSSDPFLLCFCMGNDKDYDCSIPILEVRVYRGELFSISVVAVGQRNGTAPAVINAAILFPNDKEAYLGKSQDTRRISRSCTLLHYSVFSNSDTEDVQLSTEGSGKLYGYMITLKVILLPCPPGFSYTTASPGCDCNSFLTKHRIQSCDISSQTVQKEEHMWIGFQGLKIHPHCSPDYCKAEEMNITLDDPDIQCAFNHSGILCGACMPNLSLALGGSQCLKCSNSYIAFTALFILFGILLVIILLLLDLTTSVGTINGLIFYVNILVMNRGVFFPATPNSPYAKLLSIFIAWMNLDFGIEVCFVNGMDSYIKTWLQFVFPAYIWALVGLIIIGSRYSVTLSNHLATNAVPVLATLFLLSYTKILRTIVAALSFTFINLPDETTEAVWLRDGNIPYFKGKHIALAVFGILAFLLIAVPYTFLLLFGQLLQAVSNRRLFRWVNKVMPFFDAYHAPYKNKHRYWTGLLLFIRTAVLVAISINFAADPGINLLCIGCSAVFILSHSLSVGGVYKKWYLTMLESSFFINLITLVPFMFYFQQAVGKQRGVVQISTIVAFATFIGIVALHLIWRTRLWVLVKPRLERLATAWHARNRSEENAELQSLDDYQQSFPSTTYVDFRESLIESQYDNTQL